MVLEGTCPGAAQTYVVAAAPRLLVPPALASVVSEALTDALPSGLHLENGALTSSLAYQILLSDDEAGPVFVVAEDSLGSLVVRAQAVSSAPGSAPTESEVETSQAPHGPGQLGPEPGATPQRGSRSRAAPVPQTPLHDT